MAYTLSKTNGGTLILLNDGVVDSSVSSIKLIGKNVANFGDAQNENFVHMLENFAFNVEPRSPLVGQLWFNTSESVLRPVAFDGVNWRPLAVLSYGTTTTNTLVNAGGSPVSSSRPGDLWFDSINKQLHVVTSGVDSATETTLIGPESVTGFGTTRMASVKMLDNMNVGHAVIQTIVNGEVISIQSPDTFTQTLNNPIPGFPKVYRGITFKNFSTSTKIVSTSTDLALYGILDHLDLSFTRNTNEEHLVANWTVDNGFKLQFGTTAQSSVSWNSSDLLLTSTGGIKLQSASSLITFDGNSLTATSGSVNLGSSTSLFANAYVGNINGGSTSAVGNIEGDWRLTTGSKLSPTFDLANDLGTVTHRFNKAFIKGLDAGTPSTDGTINGAWSLTTSSSLAPVADLGNNLGNATKRFGVVYATGISAGSNTSTIAVTGSPVVNGDLVPAVDGAYELGTPELSWASVNATQVDATVVGAVQINSTNLETEALSATAGTIDSLTAVTEIFTNLIDSFGVSINKFDTDTTLTANSHSRLPTQNAVKTYVDLIRSQLLTSINNIRTVPAGAVFYSAGSGAPAGYVIANGATYPTTGQYADLFAVIGYTYGGSGGTFAVPDLRGQFTRGADLGRGLDPGRVLGSTQGDSFRAHSHPYVDTYFKEHWGPDGQYAGAVGSNGGQDNDNYDYNYQRVTSSSGGTETRPTNIALLPIIKL